MQKKFAHKKNVLTLLSQIQETQYNKPQKQTHD